MPFTTRRPPLHTTASIFSQLTQCASGKVRDMYNVPEHPDTLLMVATDRISAYDVIMDDAIPGKGKVLTSLTLMWLKYLSDVIPNHLITADVNMYPQKLHIYEDALWGRSMLVKKMIPLPIECIVRGYISGSMWKAYKDAQSVNGFKNVLWHILRDDMQESEIFDEVLFTPSTKAALGEKDENISFDQMVAILTVFLFERSIDNVDPQSLALKVKDVCIALYKKAAIYAKARGIIIADTKFELGLDSDNNLVLIDEVLTPDSSRFWPAETHEIGKGQKSFDKQYLRDYLSTRDWNKNPPAPTLPLKIINGTADRYREVEKILCKI